MSKPLTATQWELVVKFQKLTSWALKHYGSRLNPEARERLQVVLSDSLEKIAAEYNSELGLKFEQFYFKCIRNTAVHFLIAERRHETAFSELQYKTVDCYRDDNGENVVAVAEVYSLLSRVASTLALSQQRLQLVTAVLRGEKTTAEAGAELGITDEGFRLILNKVRSKAQSLALAS